MSRALLGLGSGIGLVAANMIGAGIFLSAGYMVQEMGPGWILADWVLGMVLAIAGARAFAELARLVPRSGGEYRYLSELMHPSLGYLAGWGSLLVGFSAPIAINAVGAAVFLDTVTALPDTRLVATAFIVVLTLSHSVGLDASKWTQNVLIVVKVVLLVGFVAMGLLLGDNSWPTWRPPSGSVGFESGPFFGNLFWIVFAFSGWNAAIYAASEFRDPVRDVQRSMILGAVGVGLLYLLINWVFVANLTPGEAGVAVEEATLGHALTAKLIGPTGARLMSVCVALAFLSTMSAMTMVGPRVYAAMAEDGFLPRALVARAGRPPVGSILFQSAVALAIVWTHSIKHALQNVGALLVVFSALAAASLFAVKRRRPDLPRPHPVALACAGLYVAVSMWILVFGIRRVDRSLLAWAGAMTVAAVIAYLATELMRSRKRS